jgi:creatinine amidohydrolase
MEQHGLHLPMRTDALLLDEIVRRAERELTTNVLFAPLQWLGSSTHHLDFAGTISASPRVYIDLLIDQANSFLTHGFGRVVYLNGHGGNITPARQAAYELRQSHREQSEVLLLSVAYWDCVPPETDWSSFAQAEMGHACEWETSMVLAIDPGLVATRYPELEAVPISNSLSPAFRAWTTRERTSFGHIGFPAEACQAKGDDLLGRFSAGVIHLLERVGSWNGQRFDE